MPYPIDTYIFYIATKEEASIILEQTQYENSTLSSDGFIHFCSYGQIVNVVDTFFVGVTDLKLLIIDINSLHSQLRFEAPAGTISVDDSTPQLFPHLYGALNIDAIVNIVDFKQFNKANIAA
jgi:uncharacterized protein (DUF952 family)